MRLTSVLLVLGGVAVSAAHAQQPTGAAQPSSMAQPPSVGSRQVHRVLAPPKSVTVQGPPARSTAQTLAAHADAPLAQVPAFAVADANGKATSLGSSRSGHWLLLYRSEHCPACDKVMAALARSDSPLFKQGTPYVIVIKKSGETVESGMLAKLQNTYPTLANATWVEDVNGEGFKALKPHGEPVLYAVSGNDIAWVQHGTLKNPAILENLASSWLSSTTKSRPVATNSTSTKVSAVSNSTKATAFHSH